MGTISFLDAKVRSNVHILTALLVQKYKYGRNSATSTKVQILTALLVQKYKY